jgi:hypothetical protein
MKQTVESSADLFWQKARVTARKTFSTFGYDASHARAPPF